MKSWIELISLEVILTSMIGWLLLAKDVISSIIAILVAIAGLILAIIKILVMIEELKEKKRNNEREDNR
jgi:hypothetical protein